MGIEVCFLNLVKDQDSKANTILNVENFLGDRYIRLNIAFIKCFIGIPNQYKTAKKKMLKGIGRRKLQLFIDDICKIKIISIVKIDKNV